MKLSLNVILRLCENCLPHFKDTGKGSYLLFIKQITFKIFFAARMIGLVLPRNYITQAKIKRRVIGKLNKQQVLMLHFDILL